MKSAVPALPIMITPITLDTLPSSLKLMELKTTRINELAVIEHCLWLLQQQGPPLSKITLMGSSVLLGLMVDQQQLMPTSIIITELTELLPAQVPKAMNNVKRVRTSLLNVMVDVIGELFLPDTNDLLLQCKSDGA
jgi:hypothetical protein